MNNFDLYLEVVSR